MIRSRRSTVGLVLFAFVSAACTPGDSGAGGVTVRDSAGVTIVENDLLRLDATCAIPTSPTVAIGSGEGEEAYQLHRVFGARRLSDGRIVLVNQGSQQIRFYDAAGKFVSQSGRPGQGPGEFSDAFYLWVLPGDTIWVGDYRPWQFLVFGPDGTWKRTVRPMPQYPNSPEVIEVLDDGRSILAERSRTNRTVTGFSAQYLTPVIHAADGTLLDTIGTFPNGRIGNMGDTPSGPWAQPHFESYARVSAAGSRVVIGHGSTAELSVYRATDTLQLERLVRWTTVDRTVSPADVKAERDRLAKEYATDDAAMYQRLVAPLIREDRIAAEMFPAFSGMIVGRDGRIWAREYPMPDRPPARNYLVFDTEGRFVCRVSMPSFDNVFEFGADYLIALQRDSLDVERVLQFPIGAPAVAK